MLLLHSLKDLIASGTTADEYLILQPFFFLGKHGDP